MEENKKKVYKSFLKTTTKLVDIYDSANLKNRKIKYLPEWLEFYTSQLLEENNNKHKLYSTY
ncbi:hypothetical protein NL493_28430, partial [Klebsiella pneumoniae]|nr:hypothetical protein [Klebsiella pneumoniae]